ncbi:MAG: FAD:protein FMN transferase [Thermoanaerobaculales bacterium]
MIAGDPEKRIVGGPLPLRRMVAPAIFVVALFITVFTRQPQQSARLQEWVVSGPTMGTTFTVKVVADDLDEAGRRRLAAKVREAVDDVDGAMSTYKPESELSRFNRHGTEPFEASRELVEVMTEALAVARLSRGAFDITVGPLVDAWGFGPGPSAGWPSEERLAKLMAVIGWEKLKIDSEQGLLYKTRTDLRCDLSAIAKGYAVDRVASSLDGAGIRDYMVEIGGEVRTRGRNATRRVWRIGVERPDESGREVRVAVALSDAAMATSGDYRNFRELDGDRVSHTIDPRTGHPVTHELASVSVISQSCMRADALATALDVLGPDEGWALAEEAELAALFLVRTSDGGFDEFRTPMWAELTQSAEEIE